jgi:hypothetical protein
MLKASCILGLAASLSLYCAQAFADQAIVARDRAEIESVTRQLIDAENLHDVDAVTPLVWDSPSTLFVAKAPQKDSVTWIGFWGKDVVMQHFHDLYQGTFHMDPVYEQQRIVALTPDVAVEYLPTVISVSYAGQSPMPHNFILVFNWIRKPDGWKMATDVALPMPAPVPG